jgi:hypothetical protein
MIITSKNQYDVKKIDLISLIIPVFAIKIIIFFIDPTVMFFIDDSSRYIDTAVSSYIPPDRSFLYGFLIRWLTYFSQSLTTLVFFQVLCSAASAIILGYLLNRFLSVNRYVAITFAVLCAIAPIQLMYERYVMTETVSLLFFALFVIIAFYYIRYPKIRTLFILNLSGVILIAFRLSYLPIVLCGAVIVPGLAFFNLPIKRHSDKTDGQGIREAGIGKRIMVSCFHLLISCLLTYGLHSSYKIINGRLSDNPPAYQYRSGFHLLSSWAPLLEKEDLIDPEIWAYTQEEMSFDLKDRFQRMEHRWNYYGLIGYINRIYDSTINADRAAHDAALNILLRNPFGVIKLAFQSYMDYWDIELLKKNVQKDRCIRQFPDELLQILKVYYHIYGLEFAIKKTLTNQYFLNAIPWFMVLFCLPLVMLISILMDKGNHLIFLIILGIFALLIMVNATFLIHRNTMRFFHADEWIAFIFLGVLFDRVMKSGFVRATGEKFGIIHKKCEKP